MNRDAECLKLIKENTALRLILVREITMVIDLETALKKFSNLEGCCCYCCESSEKISREALNKAFPLKYTKSIP